MEFYEMNEMVKTMVSYEITDYFEIYVKILLYGFGMSFLIGFVIWGICSAFTTFKNIITK